MITAIGIDLLKQLSVLAQGRTPILSSQGWHYGGRGTPPTLLNHGVDVSDAIWASVGLVQRASSAAWRSFYRVDLADAGASYGVIFGQGSPTTVTITGEATAAAIVAELKVELEASINFTGAGGSCALVEGHEDMLEITFPEAVPVARAGSVNANESCAQEADRCLWRVWGLPLGLDRWTLLRDLPARLSVEAGELATVLCAGYRRLYLEVVDADGFAQLLVGPCRSDDQAASLLEDAKAQLAAAAAGCYAFPPTSSGGRSFKAGWDDTELSVGTTTQLLSRGGAFVEVQNRTGADLFLKLGRGAAVEDYRVPDGESWYGEEVGAVYGVLASGSGSVIVQAKEA